MGEFETCYHCARPPVLDLVCVMAAMKKAKKVSSVMKAMKGRAMRKAMKKAKATAEACGQRSRADFKRLLLTRCRRAVVDTPQGMAGAVARLAVWWSLGPVCVQSCLCV